MFLVRRPCKWKIVLTIGEGWKLGFLNLERNIDFCVRLRWFPNSSVEWRQARKWRSDNFLFFTLGRGTDLQWHYFVENDEDLRWNYLEHTSHKSYKLRWVILGHRREIIRARLHDSHHWQVKHRCLQDMLPDMSLESSRHAWIQVLCVYLYLKVVSWKIVKISGSKHVVPTESDSDGLRAETSFKNRLRRESTANGFLQMFKCMRSM